MQMYVADPQHRKMLIIIVTSSGVEIQAGALGPAPPTFGSWLYTREQCDFGQIYTLL